MNTDSIRRTRLLGFIEDVRHIHANMRDRRFCFVLGAGASKTSGIPTAGELSMEWLRKIHVERCGATEDFAQWLNEGKHGIKDIPPNTGVTDIAAIAAAYPAIYHAKWNHDPAQGHAEIERHIEAAVPSYGYYALAEILASDDQEQPSRHNVVITPNFDNLPAETLGALGKKIPIVIGHSAIADFARPTLRRPLIIKFHHDFLLAPKSVPTDVGSMDQGYSNALSEIFRLYTPIVIGYGGNDGSLMGLLEGLPEKSIPGGIQWCWRTGDPPGSRIEAVVARQGQAGALVEIAGFDELMTLLEEPFGHVFDPDKLKQRAEKRAQELTEAKERLTKKTESGLSPSSASSGPSGRGSNPRFTATTVAESAAVLDALSATAAAKPTESEKSPQLSWWHWQKRINAVTDLNEIEKLYNEGLEATRNAPQLLGNYATFLETERKDDVRAEEYYLKAIVDNPNNANNLGNYANFLKDQRKDNVRTEEYYLKAIAADPNNVNNLGNYAVFLMNQLKDGLRAEEYYLKAIAADPNNARNLGNYAIFLETLRKDDVRAEEYYLKAIAADPNNVNTLRNYALFLMTELKDDVRADEYYLKAIAADPNNAISLGSYAVFLMTRLKDDVRADEYYLKAIAADPNNANNLVNYVQHLIGREKFDEAAPFASRAWALFSDLSNMGVGEAAFSRWLLAAVTGAEGKPALGRLKTLLQIVFDRDPWSFDGMLAACLPKLSAKQGTLARKLAAAILDESALAELDAEPSWRLVQAIPLDAPWPDREG